MSRKTVQSSGYLTWEQATAKFIPWAISAMVGYATYNIDKLTTSVTNLNTILTKYTVIVDDQGKRLDRQGVLILEQVNKNSIQDAEIAALKAIVDKK